MTTSGVKANGDLYTDTAKYVRTAGTSGLMGSWKSTAVKLSSPDELIMQESGLDRLMIKIPALKAYLRGQFRRQRSGCGGTRHSYRVSPGPHPHRALQFSPGAEIERQHDFDSSVYTVSDDGKTMTEVGGAPGDPPATVIWEKQ